MMQTAYYQISIIVIVLLCMLFPYPFFDTTCGWLERHGSACTRNTPPLFPGVHVSFAWRFNIFTAIVWNGSGFTMWSGAVFCLVFTAFPFIWESLQKKTGKSWNWMSLRGDCLIFLLANVSCAKFGQFHGSKCEAIVLNAGLYVGKTSTGSNKFYAEIVDVRFFECKHYCQ